MKKIRLSDLGYHFYPENPMKMHSIVEIVVFVLVFIFCAFLFYRWNVVPVREVYFEVEDLGDGHGKDDLGNRDFKESSREVLSCKISFITPMTRTEEVSRDSIDTKVRFYAISSKSQHSDFINNSFYLDSVRNGLIQSFSWDKVIGKEEEAYRVYKNYLGKSNKVKDSLEVLRKPLIKADKSNANKRMAYVYLSQSVPFGTLSSNEKEPFPNVDPTCTVIDSYGFSNGKVWQRCLVSGYKVTGGCYKTNASSPTIAPYIFPFFGGPITEAPRWGRLEDISQAYYNLRIKSETIDSIILNIDFVGAAKFSAMYPEPDLVTMSSIEFNNPEKIFLIRSNGLKFHVKFEELENFQSIRVFAVTAIMSSFILIFVVFGIQTYFLWLRTRKRNKGDVPLRLEFHNNSNEQIKGTDT